jgi:hypothetical protein
MPFRLKSAAGTYQRGIQWCLYSQLGCNVEAYVADVVVKTRKEKRLISDLADLRQPKEIQNEAKS